jgi:hypothetical protein
VRPAAGMAGKVGERGLGAQGGPVVAGVSAGQHRRGAHGEAEVRRPLQAQCRRGDNMVGATSGTRSFSMCLRADLRG